MVCFCIPSKQAGDREALRFLVAARPVLLAGSRHGQLSDELCQAVIEQFHPKQRRPAEPSGWCGAVPWLYLSPRDLFDIKLPLDHEAMIFGGIPGSRTLH